MSDDHYVGDSGAPKTALTNVRVFDGRRLRDPDTVVIEGNRLGTDPAGARVIDGAGATLLPGLFDAHVHLRGVHDLERLSSYGVTTALDMTMWPSSLVDSLRGLPGLTDIRSCGLPAIPPGGPHARLGFPEQAQITEPEQAARFVADRVAEGSDYIKIIVDPPGPHALSAPTLQALVTAAREHGKLTIAHALSAAAVGMALRAGVDMLTHAPFDTVLDEATVARIAATDRVIVPTLVIMAETAGHEFAQTMVPGAAYGPARASVAALYQAGVPVLAGTDTSSSPNAPIKLPFGQSLHHELELLVDAGLSTVDALRAATVLPAKHFGLNDRGAIQPGRRADLLLIAGDPVTDITATQKIQRVWCAGTERTPA